MIKKRSQVAHGKQVLMGDYSSIPSPKQNHKKPTSFPGLLTSFKSFTETTESVMSPTSILDSKPFLGFRNSLPDHQIPTPKTTESETRRTWDKLDSKGIGLAIVDDYLESNVSKPEGRMVLFGSQLKVQVPSVHVSSTDQSPRSPCDFGIKTRSSFCSSSNLGMDNPNNSPSPSPRLLADMELSEDYTCVITYGPHPKTTHIFDDRIVETRGGLVEFTTSKPVEIKKNFNNYYSSGSSFPSENFLSSCYGCKKNLEQGKDIFMYRGEKAFCSSECRYEEMLSEEVTDKQDDEEDIFGSCSSIIIDN